MATMVYHIELRCPGITDDKKLEALKKAVHMHARNLYGSAMLVAGNDSRPAIACYSEDFISGQEQILGDINEDSYAQEEEGDDD